MFLKILQTYKVRRIKKLTSIRLIVVIRLFHGLKIFTENLGKRLAASRLELQVHELLRHKPSTRRENKFATTSPSKKRMALGKIPRLANNFAVTTFLTTLRAERNLQIKLFNPFRRWRTLPAAGADNS